MTAQAQMQLLGKINGTQWYWAEPGKFAVPGVYYWDGKANVHVQAATPSEVLAMPTEQEVKLATLAAEHYGRPPSDIPALIEFERHRAEQVKIPGMPEMHGAIPNFIAGYKAALARAPATEQAKPELAKPDFAGMKPIGYAQQQPLLEYAPMTMLYAMKPAPENGFEAFALYSEDQVHVILAAQVPQANWERYRFLADAKPNALHLSRNGDHACNYMTAKQWIEDEPECFSYTPEAEVRAMEETDTIWQLQIYRNTPISSCSFFGATMDSVIDQALAAALKGV
jgi:hypothetical protein